MSLKRVLNYLHKKLINVGRNYKIILITKNQLFMLETALSYFNNYSTTGLKIDEIRENFS